MIIDPYKDGVYIWTDSNVTSIKGKHIPDICEEIYSRVVQPRISGHSGYIIYDQIYELYIDIGGVGIDYKDILTRMGLKVSDIRYRKINDILPIRCPDKKRSVTKETDIKPVFRW